MADLSLTANGNFEEKCMSRRGKRRKGARRQKRKATFGLTVLVILAVLVVLCVQIVLRRYIGKFDKNIIIQGVFVGNTDVSGLTVKEAKEKVAAELSVYADTEITLKLDESRQASVRLGDLGLSIKGLDEMIEDAVQYGKTGSAVTCYKILKKAEAGKNEKHFPVEYQVTEKKASGVLEAALGGLLEGPENARVTLEGEETVIVKEKPGEVLNVKETVKAVNKAIGDKWNGEDRTAAVVVDDKAPEVTAEKLNGITDLLGSYTTFYGSDGTGRAMNIESGTKHIDGTLLEPGEEMSANAKMEPYTTENGYAEAASYEGDEVVQSMGGGICQVSTTLYNAVLLAELEVTQRSPHSMLVSYVEPSMDAAIADDVLDLRFRNNLDTPIYIEGELADDCVTFRIFGKETRDPGRTIQYVSETTDTKQPESKKFVATDDAIGYYYTKNQAQPEISARLWKVIYENGAEVSRDIVNYSQYLPTKETIAIGTASSDEADTAKMKEAIATQNEEQIMQVMNQILYGVQEETTGDNTGENQSGSGTAENGTEDAGDSGTAE